MPQPRPVALTAAAAAARPHRRRPPCGAAPTGSAELVASLHLLQAGSGEQVIRAERLLGIDEDRYGHDARQGAGRDDAVDALVEQEPKGLPRAQAAHGGREDHPGPPMRPRRAPAGRRQPDARWYAAGRSFLEVPVAQGLRGAGGADTQCLRCFEDAPVQLVADVRAPLEGARDRGTETLASRATSSIEGRPPGWVGRLTTGAGSSS